MTDPIAAEEQDNLNATIKSHIDPLVGRIEAVRHSTDQLVLDINKRMEKIERRVSGVTLDEAREAAAALFSAIGILEMNKSVDPAVGKRMKDAVATLAAGAGL